jgi:hypothetical protein
VLPDAGLVERHGREERAALTLRATRPPHLTSPHLGLLISQSIH